MGDFFEETFHAATGPRTYKVHIPRTRSPREMPLIVLLHGCTQSPEDFAAGTCMNTLSDQHSCVIAYPAQPAAANIAKCWNWFSPAHQQRGEGEPSIIAGITRAVMQAHRIDERRVFIAGMSAGASMSVIMAATYPELYAGAGAHSGLPYRSATSMLEAFSAMRDGTSGRQTPGAAGIPIIVFHGDDDRTVNPRNSETIIRQWLESRAEQHEPQTSSHAADSSSGRAYTRKQYCDRRGTLLAEHWLVSGLGHAWSGGSAQDTYTDPSGPDASRAMLQFFLCLPTKRRDGFVRRLMQSLKLR